MGRKLMPSSDQGTSVIQCRGISKSFGGDPVVNGVDLDVGLGKSWPSSGPAAAARPRCCEWSPDSRSLDTGTRGACQGKPAAGARRLDAAGRTAVGDGLPGLRPVSPHDGGPDNVAFGLTDLDRSEKAIRVSEALDLVRLSGMADRYPHQLSGGEQQRVAVARSLAPRPIALLLDEPFSNLDMKLRESLQQDVKEIFSLQRRHRGLRDPRPGAGVVHGRHPGCH